MYDDAYTRNQDEELAVRIVSTTGDNGTNKDDVFTRDDEGRLSLRTVGGSGGGGSVDKNKIINKSETLPTPSASNLGQAYMYDGESTALYTHGYIYQVVAEQTATDVVFSGNIITSWAVADFVRYMQEGGASYNEVVRGTLTYDESGGLWNLVGYDENGIEVLKFHEYTEDLVDFGCIFASETHQDGDACSFTLTTTASGYKWKRLDVQPAGGSGGDVSSVNGKTGAVILGAKDVNAIPQYLTMPTASASNVGEIAQYSGESILDSYQNGYFYKSYAEYSDPTATISQTTGSSLSDLAVDLDTFVEAEQPTQDEDVVFTASVSGTPLFESPVEMGDSGVMATVDTAKMIAFIATKTDHIDYDYIKIRNIAADNTRLSIYFKTNVSAWSNSISVNNLTDSALADAGIVLDGVVADESKTGTTYWQEAVVTWERDSETVDLNTYGITFAGTPDDGDEITVSYTAPAPIGYHWEQIDVQPGGGSGSIAWALETDLPANWSPNDVWATTPIYTIAGGLPDGTYEYYFQVLNSSSGVESIAPVTYKMLFTINNTSCIVKGNIGYVINGDFMSDGNQTPSNNYYYNIFGMVGSDLKIFRTDQIFCTDIPGYINPVPEVKGCFKITAIKNVATGESYIPTAELYDGTNEPQYTTYYNTSIKSCALAQEPDIPTYHRNTSWSIDNSTPYVYVGASVSKPSNSSSISEIDIYLKTDSGGEFHVVVENSTDSYIAKVIKATGNIANTQVFYNDSTELAIDLNLPSDTTDYLHISVGIKGSSTGIGSIWRPSDISEFTNTLVLTKVGGTIDASNLGIILQYDGTTTASYTNGYFYRADGTLVSVPESLNASDYSINDFSVTVDAPNLIVALIDKTGWSKEYMLQMINDDYDWTIYYDADNQSITSIYWGGFGQMTDADILQCFTVSTSLTGTVNCTFKMAYTPGYKEVQNPSWTRVDTQPLDLTGITGYDATKTQVLKNVLGIFTWVDE